MVCFAAHFVTFTHCYAAQRQRTRDCSFSPNHKLFDKGSYKLSPVLQHRLDAQNNAKQAMQAQPASAPVINVTIGKEIADLFHPLLPAVPPADPLPVPPMPALTRLTYNLNCPTVLQQTRLAGKGM
jgi:hypothetical protein